MMKALRYFFSAILATAVLAASGTDAQVQGGFPPFVGTLTANNCIKAANSYQGRDSGAPCGAGTVPTGTANDLAYWATTGTALSPLPSANNGVLVTNGSGSPSISTALPSGISATNLALTTPTLGVATGTTLALNGATIGSNALAVSGPTSLGGELLINTGGSNQFLVGQNSGSSTYNTLSLNGALSSASNVGLSGGGGSDKSLYAQAASTGSVNLQVNNSTVLSASSTGISVTGSAGVSGAVNFTGLSSSAGTATVCIMISSGAISYDASVDCNLSLEELKYGVDNHIDPARALETVLRFKPFWGGFRDPKIGDTSEIPMFGAHQIEGVEPRLSYYENGKLRSVRYLHTVPLLAAAIQGLSQQSQGNEAEILELSNRVAVLESAHADQH